MDEGDREREVAAENMELLLHHLQDLRNTLPPHPAVPILSDAAQSWNTTKTLITILTVAASFVVATLTIGHWWGVADENFALLKRIDRAVVRMVVQIQSQDRRIRTLERQRGIASPPEHEHDEPGSEE